MTRNNKTTWPDRVTSKELAAIWKVTKARVSQFVSAGKIDRGEDGLIDLKQALAFRAQALTDQHVNVLFQTYGNRHGRYEPKIMDHLEDELVSDEEALGLPPKVNEVSTKDAMKDALLMRGKLDGLRLREQEAKLAAAQRRADREAGQYVERSEVFRRCQEAGAEITGMLRTLEYEIPGVFSDRETRADVRKKIQEIVDTCIFTMNRKFGVLGVVLEDEI